MHASLQPTRLLQYEVTGTLSLGQNWRIYKGSDPALGRTVALKVISKRLLSSFGEGLLVRLQAEAQAAAILNHPGIVSIYECGEDSDCVFVAMEYVEGWRLRERFRVPGHDAVNLIVQLLDALSFAHEKGILHREINPSNLLLTHDGHLRIANFGVVRLRSGMPSYMAPEQFMGLNSDHRTDIFSAGVIFYELLTGANPFPGPARTTADRVCRDQERAPSQVNTSLSHAFDSICARALAKSINERYPTAKEFCDDVRGAGQDTGAGAQVSSPVSSDTLVAYASFPKPADGNDAAGSLQNRAAAPSAEPRPATAAATNPPAQPPPAAIPSSISAGAKPVPGKSTTTPSASRLPSPAKGIAPQMAARLENLLGGSPGTLAGYYEDWPCPVERAIHAFVASVQALVSIGPANCRSEALFPQNISLDPLGKAIILDPQQSKPQNSLIANSPRYAAPEMFAEKAVASDPSSAAAHVYALGTMFYEILLGKASFEKAFANQRTDLAWLRWQADLESRAPSLKSLLPDCPAALSDLIESMMEKHVEKRQANLDAILSTLRGIARRSNKTVVLRKPAVPAAEPAPKPVSRVRNQTNNVAVVILSILALTSVVGLAALWMHPQYQQYVVDQLLQLMHHTYGLIRR
jgi:eukaryotic-like serine/threonine-protein kinase